MDFCAMVLFPLALITSFLSFFYHENRSLSRSNPIQSSPNQIKSKTMGCGPSHVATKYDDYDWKELPPEAQEAAKVLGYNKKIWNNDGKVPCEDNDWEELTQEQQDAAAVLGYDQKTWDG